MVKTKYKYNKNIGKDQRTTESKPRTCITSALCMLIQNASFSWWVSFLGSTLSNCLIINLHKYETNEYILNEKKTRGNTLIAARLTWSFDSSSQGHVLSFGFYECVTLRSLSYKVRWTRTDHRKQSFSWSLDSTYHTVLEVKTRLLMKEMSPGMRNRGLSMEGQRAWSI